MTAEPFARRGADPAVCVGIVVHVRECGISARNILAVHSPACSIRTMSISSGLEPETRKQASVVLSPSASGMLSTL